MSKSILAIAGIGLAGCILLSVTMQQLVKEKTARDEARPLATFAVRHRTELVAPLATHEENHGAVSRFVVHARVTAGVDRPAFAAAIAAAAWQQLRDDPLVHEVQVTVRNAAGGEPHTLVAPRPAAAPPR